MIKCIPKVETPEQYLDIAFRKAKLKAGRVRTTVKGRRDATKLVKSRQIEIIRIQTMRDSLTGSLTAVIDSFPIFDELPPFYRELVKSTLDHPMLMHALGAANWARNKIRFFASQYSLKIKQCRQLEKINDYRRECYGRISSVLKQIKNELLCLDESRKIMQCYPAVKTKLLTVVIAGYPNVGKTTLLKALTGSAPEIASYPFTTKKLMIGYRAADGQKLQFIDTPGLLDRPLAERNRIELQAILALKHLATAVVFMIDPSESCGYGIKEQLNLLKEVKRMFGITPIVVLNKVDITQKEIIDNLKSRLTDVIEISAEKSAGIEGLLGLIKAKLAGNVSATNVFDSISTS